VKIRATPLIVILWSGVLAAQSAPQFEVASVRVSSEQPTTNAAAAGVHIAGSQVRIASLPLKDYVAIAYAVRPSQVIGPEWIGQSRFDVSANLPAGATRAEVPAMLQALLAERFAVKAHRESRESPVYALTVAKGGLKIRPSPPAPGEPAVPGAVDVAGAGSAQGVNLDLGGGTTFTLADNAIEAKRITMTQLASTLTRFTDRTVVDETGLASGERYDVTLMLTSEEYQATLIRSGVNAGIVLDPRALRFLDRLPSNPLGPALEQAGLTLDSRKSPLDVIVVDAASKTPSEN
jgi:uncharacterized protein (TIGR03435 family)